jgi:hypothetical protein
VISNSTKVNPFCLPIYIVLQTSLIRVIRYKIGGTVSPMDGCSRELWYLFSFPVVPHVKNA